MCEMRFEKWKWPSHGKNGIWTFSARRNSLFKESNAKKTPHVRNSKRRLALPQHSQRARRSELRPAGWTAGNSGLKDSGHREECGSYFQGRGHRLRQNLSADVVDIWNFLTSLNSGAIICNPKCQAVIFNNVKKTIPVSLFGNAGLLIFLPWIFGVLVYRFSSQELMKQGSS